MILAATVLLAVQASTAAGIPAYISEAVADPLRPETDRARDADRAPAKLMAFAGIEPGDKVADFMPGDGYFTRLLCKVVGRAGHVYAIFVPRSPPTTSSPRPQAESCGNVTSYTLLGSKRSAPELWSSDDDPGMVYEYSSLIPAAENFAVPEQLDVIWISQGYRDLHHESFGPPNMLAVNQALLKALKPGGLLVIEDRGDSRPVKREVLAAGFEFAAGKEHLLKFRKPW